MFISKGHFGIKIIPMGDIPIETMDYVSEIIRNVFRKNAFRTRSVKIPMEAYDLTTNQYKTGPLLDYLERTRLHKEKVLGIIDEDITKSNRIFVFGDASAIDEMAVISIWRFQQNLRYFDCDINLYKGRVKKTVIQELAHTFGLHHCSDPGCIMNYSRTMDELDRKSDEFCSRCKKWF